MRPATSESAAIQGGSVVLIGMPGAGKSTAGVILAKRLALDFTDTDILIQSREGRSLQSIVDSHGYAELRRIEADVLARLQLAPSVIATGGSAVYSAAAMAHLKCMGQLVYLRISLEEILRRVTNSATRGLARRPEQTLEDLFHEREVLYERYADIGIDCDGLTPEETVQATCLALTRG